MLNVSGRSGRRRLAALGVSGVLLLAACTSSSDDASTTSAAPAADSSAPETAADTTEAAAEETTPPQPRFRYPDAPAAPTADAASVEAVDGAIDTIISVAGGDATLDLASVSAIAEAGDLRHAWFLSDLLRFFRGDDANTIVESFESLAGVQIADDPDSAQSPWMSVTNHLIAWDTPAYPGYREDKSGIFLLVENRWEPFFTDDDADIDFRLLSWGGVLIDNRPLGDTESCSRGCIPALDDPATTDAAGGAWYPDEMIVFGLVEGDEALAFPKNIAEIHEMFNLTLGGRRFGVPYCTLCGSAQAYYTDNTDAAEQPVLRTSGLLTRSNKVMYDLVTQSVFDTFTGEAVSGPLQDQGIALEEATLVRSTWGEWKQAHPNTQIIAEDGGIGRSYQLDPLGGRDDNGPIFPIGPADDRLDVQELIVGVIAPDGTPLAFPSDLSSDVLEAGGEVSLGGVSLQQVGGGLKAVDAETGDDVAAHEAFWFAWSQFHPDTLLFAD